MTAVELPAGSPTLTGLKAPTDTVALSSVSAMVTVALSGEPMVTPGPVTVPRVALTVSEPSTKVSFTTATVAMAVVVVAAIVTLPGAL